MYFLLASNNPDKKREIERIMHPYSIMTPKDIGIEYHAEETGKTFLENALIKAETLYKTLKLPVIADDTGLCCDFLNGAPGVYSARFAGENATYEDNRKKLIELAKKVPEKERTAHFITVAVLYLGEERYFHFEGRVDGIILTEQRGKNGFGYDPIFYYPPLKMTFAEMPEKLKNSVSHRHKAFKKLKEFIDFLNEEGYLP